MDYVSMKGSLRIFSCGFSLIFLAGCGTNGSAIPSGPRKGDAVPVVLAAAGLRDVPLEIQVIGNVEAYATISVKSQITGPLLRVHFQEGDYVRKGDLLFSIDRSPFEAALASAEADMARTQALLGQAEATLKRDTAQSRYAQSQATRYSDLLAKGIVSRDQSEQMQSGADALAEGVRADEAAIRSAQASIAASRANADNARIQLSYTTIRSPIDGRTGNLSVKAGNLVAANTVELITINQVQPIYVTFSAPEARLPAIKSHMAQEKLAVFTSPQDAAAAPPETGTLTFIDNNVDMTTGTIKLKGTFPNADRKLWPGEFVRVTLRLTTQHDAVVVPSQAVQIGQDGSFVYLVKADMTVEPRPVVTGPRVDQDIVVERGLAAGDRIVTEGQLRLAPGMKVRTRDAGEGARKGRARG
jgi:membrane fusion protein, multidrug efflux system